MAAPPSSWEIVTAFLREAHEERARGEPFASGTVVEDRLGLSLLDGMDFMRELEDAGLIKMAEATNAAAYYRLTLKGLGFTERLPSLEAVVRQREATIDASPGPDEEKREAKFRFRDEVGKAVLQRGVDYAFDNVGEIWQQLQMAYAWLKAWIGR